MIRRIDDLVILFNKIQEGEATEEERADYELSIKASCLDEAFLRTQIEKKAENLKVE